MPLVKVADVKIQWDRSVSPDVNRVVVVTQIGGMGSTVELSPDVEEVVVEVRANQSGWIRVDSHDSEGRLAQSVTYNFTVGDLTDPQPATNFRHTILGVREVDVPDEPAPAGTALRKPPPPARHERRHPE